MNFTPPILLNIAKLCYKSLIVRCCGADSEPGAWLDLAEAVVNIFSGATVVGGCIMRIKCEK